MRASDEPIAQKNFVPPASTPPKQGPEIARVIIGAMDTARSHQKAIL
jgi:hypothetical protein